MAMSSGPCNLTATTAMTVPLDLSTVSRFMMQLSQRFFMKGTPCNSHHNSTNLTSRA